MLRRALTKLSRFMVRVRVATARGSGTRVAVALSRRLADGGTWSNAMRSAAPLIAEEALREACARFDGGPAALLIVDLRDAITRIVADAGAPLSHRHAQAGPWLQRNLCALNLELRSDDTSQRLANCVLAEAGLLSEAQVLELRFLDQSRLVRELSALLTRLVSVRITTSQGAHRLDPPSSGYELTDRLAKA